MNTLPLHQKPHRHTIAAAGVSTSSTNRDVKDLCKVADQALYVAKQTRNRIATQAEL